MPYGDDNYLHEEQSDFGKPIATAFGAVLLICGIIIGLWIIMLVAQMINDPAQMIESDISGPFTIGGGAENDEFNIDMSAETASFAIRVFLITIAVSLCATFIKGGATLLTGSLRKLTSKFDTLNRNVKSMADKINQQNRPGS